MKLWEIVGKKDSELEGKVFGHFSDKQLAKHGMKKLPKEIAGECFIRESNLSLNTLEIDGKTVDVVDDFKPKVHKKRNEITGYVKRYLFDIEEDDGSLESFFVGIAKEISGGPAEDADILEWDLIGITDRSEMLIRAIVDYEAVQGRKE